MKQTEKNESQRQAQETNGCPADKTLTKSALGRRGGMMNESTAGKLAEMVRRALKDPERRQELLKLLESLGLLQGDGNSSLQFFREKLKNDVV